MADEVTYEGDIVLQLRRAAEWTMMNGQRHMLQCAADEIERLRCKPQVQDDNERGFVTITMPAHMAGAAEGDAVSEWIPVSERLPEPDTETMLLVCVECEDGSRSVDVARWRLDADGKPSWGDVCGSNQTIYGWSQLFVVAWMPLPEPPEVT